MRSFGGQVRSRLAGGRVGSGRARSVDSLDRPPEHQNIEGIQPLDWYRLGLERLLGVPASDGSTVRTLRNGDEIFPAMLDAIRESNETVDLCTFVYWTGDIAEAMAEALSERARAGVRVRVLVDAVGGRQMENSLTAMMEEAGVDFRWFRPMVQWRFWEAEHRTHRKILVCDGKVGFTGGVGIAAEWEGDGRSPGNWRDSHFRFEGPVVAQIHASFLRNWVETDGARVLEVFEAQPAPDDLDDGSAMMVVHGHASTVWSDTGLLLRSLVASARERIRIHTAYFSPDDDFLARLLDAAERGVDIQILLPGSHIDKRVAAITRDIDLEKVLDAGIRVWRYRPSMMHMKAVSVDGQLACVGSANVNGRSMARDDEVSVIVLDPRFAQGLEADFEADLEHADPVQRRRWRRRSIFRKGFEQVLRPFKRFF
ncbi:MAG: phospholipase D-like domain-containing protein [Actinomycetota bacterium]|nr:phospholipase D-like domain-containing protein [Actinomycetota bacterium]